MTLTIKRLCGGPLETNAYLVADTATGDAVLVDTPPDILDDVVHAANELGATINEIVITHGHWDHVLDVHTIATHFDAPILGHSGVRERLEQPNNAQLPRPMPPATLDREIDEGDEVLVGGHVFQVLYMPGHDEAHVVLYSERDGVVLGGDVLFPDGHGRTDLPGSDQATMNRTLRRFLDMPDDVRVLPGHGNETTIERESIWIRNIPSE